MPTKKTLKKKEINSKENNSFDIQKLMQNSDSYKSLIYGIVTVIVLFIVIALGVRTLSQNKAQIDEQAAMTDDKSDVLTNSYVVSEGETLWSIAEKSYKDGYAWVEIAKANNLTEPYELEKGQKLIIPKINPTETPIAMESPIPTPTEVVISPTASSVVTEESVEQVPASQKITGSSYSVVRGDNLWTIAVRAYGDGYRWVEIARLNNLANPDLIFSGNELKLARP